MFNGTMGLTAPQQTSGTDARAGCGVSARADRSRSMGMRVFVAIDRLNVSIDRHDWHARNFWAQLVHAIQEHRRSRAWSSALAARAPARSAALKKCCTRRWPSCVQPSGAFPPGGSSAVRATTRSMIPASSSSQPGRVLSRNSPPMSSRMNRSCPFCFPAVCHKRITAAFDGGRISSDGGVMLLAQADRRLGIAERLAQAIPDARDPDWITHLRRISCAPAFSPLPAATKTPTTSIDRASIQRSSWRAAACRIPAGTCARSRLSRGGRMCPTHAI